MSIRFLTLAASVCAVSAAPLFHKTFSLQKANLELKAFNNAADILVMMPEGNDANGRSVPAILRGDAVVNLYPTGEGPFTSVYVDGMSERRDNGGVFVAGTVVSASGFHRAAIWDVAANGAFAFKVAPNIILPEDSAAPGEQLYGNGLAVNTSGVMAGSGSSYLASLATIWAPPYTTAVRYLLSTGSSFTEINNDGLLLANGVEFDHGNEFNRYTPAVLVAGGVPTEVPGLEPMAGNLYPTRAIDMSGEWVTGVSQKSDSSRAFVWKRGAAASVNLPNSEVYPDAQNTIPWGVNASGNVIGMINGGNSGGNILFWEHKNGTHVAHLFGSLVPEEPYSSHRAEEALINDDGQIVFLVRNWGSSTIARYDLLTDGFVQMAGESAFGSEEEGRVEFLLNAYRAAGNDAAMSVRVRTVNDTAVAPNDFIALDTTVTWGPGESGDKVVAVTIPDNNTYQDWREFKLELVSATGAQLGQRRVAVGNIMPDDSQIVVRNSMWGEAYYGVPVLRGQTQATIQLERVGSSDGALSIVSYAYMDISAYADVDYTRAELPRLTWARGELGVKTVTIPILNPEFAATQPVMFNFSGHIDQEGNESETDFYTNVAILPADDKSSPTISAWSMNNAKTELSCEVNAPQGAVVQLRQSASLDAGWTTASEQTAADGTVRFTIPVSTQQSCGFFNVRVKP